MLTLATVQMLYDYNCWANQKVRGCIDTLTDTQFKQDTGYAFHSLHGQTVHVMSAEWVWLARLKGYAPTSMFKNEAFPTWQAVRARWEEIEEEFRDFLTSLDEARLGETFQYATTAGVPYQNRYGEILLHVINHGTDHRAQMLAMLHQLGAPTVEQDIIFYLRERQPS